MTNNHNITAEELWQKIITLKTTQEWMDLTNGFSLYTIYHHCRILQDPVKIETYQCMIRKEYPKSLEKFDEKDPLVVCYMMMAFFTACSEKYVSRKLYEGFTLTERHKPHIDRINQLFSDFNLPISLKVGTSY